MVDIIACDNIAPQEMPPLPQLIIFSGIIWLKTISGISFITSSSENVSAKALIMEVNPERSSSLESEKSSFLSDK